MRLCYILKELIDNCTFDIVSHLPCVKRCLSSGKSLQGKGLLVELAFGAMNNMLLQGISIQAYSWLMVIPANILLSNINNWSTVGPAEVLLKDDFRCVDFSRLWFSWQLKLS